MTPANDNAPTKLAEQLAALLEYRNRPPEKVEPVQSNWTTTPSALNADPSETVDYRFERHLRMTPSVQEIMRQVEVGPVERNGDGQVVAIGRLKFSDGTQTEKACMRGPDGDVIDYDRRMPTGAMLHTREKAEAPMGGVGYRKVELDNSNLYFAAALGTLPPRFVKAGKRRNGPSLNAEQSRALIDDAITNTPTMPPVTYLPPGLPCASRRISECFSGMQLAANGESATVQWQDVSGTIENSAIWAKVMSALGDKDVAALDAAMSAQTLADVGEAVGQSKSYATYNQGGKRALIAANDNLKAELKKHSA